MQNGNNNYCRNCGEKLPLKVSECPKCHTKIINKRVLTDDGYIVYIIGNIMCIIFFIESNNFYYILYNNCKWC